MEITRHAELLCGAGKAYQQADAALVVRAGLCNVAVLARVPPASIFMRVRIAAALPWVRALDGAWLDLHVRSTGQHAHGVLICRFRNPERLKLCRQPATPVLCPGWEVSVLCMLHVIYSKDVLWLLMPVFGVKPACPPKLPWCSNFACMELFPICCNAGQFEGDFPKDVSGMLQQLGTRHLCCRSA